MAMADEYIQNMVAKRIRDIYNNPSYDRRTLEKLALDFAEWFDQYTRTAFNPLAFLDKCSPNTQLYPLSELWGKRDA